MKTERGRMSDAAVAKHNIFPIHGGESAILPTDEPKASFIERQLHNAGYLTMANLPPARFWSWANIGNILLILGFLGGVILFVWNVAYNQGAKDNENKQRDAKIEMLEKKLEVKKQVEAQVVESDPEPSPTQTRRK
jgi:hypothetical protein